MTNFERIKNMSMEEFAIELNEITEICTNTKDCKNCPFDRNNTSCAKKFISWLRTESKGDK